MDEFEYVTYGKIFKYADAGVDTNTNTVGIFLWATDRHAARHICSAQYFMQYQQEQCCMGTAEGSTLPEALHDPDV